MPSIILAEQIRTIDKSRLQEFVGSVDELQMKRIDRALGISIGLIKMENHTKPLLMTLCRVCVKQFYDTENYYIKRADVNQKHKQDCTICSVRTGYDFLITQKLKSI